MKHPEKQRPLAPYRGRFAPSPSGLLHFGSLVTALASFLQAKSQQGHWLLRIEDIDPPREQAGASATILKTLELFGLHWDEEVLYQSKQKHLYQEVLSYLASQKITYHCQCTRAKIKSIGGIYQGYCRQLQLNANECATRLINKNANDLYLDTIQGRVTCNKAIAAEDFILVRKDGLFAYQLAVVVDDIYQGITQVVRGCDLLEPTARQLSFYHCLQTLMQKESSSTHSLAHMLPPFCIPSFAHVPLAVTTHGYKLSKQNKALAIDIEHPQPTLIAALTFLGQQPERLLINETVEKIIDWAIQHWSLEKIPKTKEIILKV
jgi:glutamyl-Q tRNA(Asp) synthetase